MSTAPPQPPTTGESEVARKVSFQHIRYAQCWEDADVLLAAAAVQPGDRCVSIASAGDNALALLTRDPAEVLAIDLSPAQLACLELRVAAFRKLDHGELLELIGSVPSTRRATLYQACREDLSPAVREFWDERPDLIAAGIGSAGKFERYFELFRRKVLPWVHSSRRIEQLLAGGDEPARREFYTRHWNIWRWRLMFRLFFSRMVMGRLGRDPRLFDYVQGSVAERIHQRVEHALTSLNPAENPYLHWILTGRHNPAVLPLALRPESFDVIRQNLDRLSWRCCSLEAWAESASPGSVDRFNLSDVFEYLSEAETERLLGRLAEIGRPGGRLVYWNMLVPRSRPQSLAAKLTPLPDVATECHQQDKAFFYSRLVVEEVA